MWSLLLPTILTSAADSLNPIAITQQFILQGMVKKPKDIWYFILPTGITNLIGGFLAYFGLVAFIDNFFSGIVESHGYYLFVAELIIGIAFLIGGAFVIQNKKLSTLKKQVQAIKQGETAAADDDEKEAASKIKSVSPIALIAMGVGATISELATALPYFAFLAILLNHQLTFLELTVILVIYNTIYTLPLAVLYFIYMKAQDKFDNIYRVIKRAITKWSNILAPTVIWIIGIVLVYHSTALLLNM